MSTYSYKPLNTEEGEIRLLSLLPAANFEDPIHLTISHAKLVAPPERPLAWMSIDDMRATLPTGWRVYENLEGRYVFWNGYTRCTTYTHPDAHFHRSRYPTAQDLECTDSEPQYEALSYTWGDIQCEQTICVKDAVDEFGPWQHLSVRTNLALALRYLRQSNHSRTLWVDAISIYQKDVSERNEQVRRMSDIFKLANRVTIWLGEESDESSLAMSTLSYLGSRVEISRTNDCLPAPGARETDWWKMATPLPYDGKVWRALEGLAFLPWFTRLWVLQEVQLANSRAIVQCGRKTASWAAFRRAVLCIRHNQGQSSITNRRLFVAVVSHFCYVQSGGPFASLLTAVWYKKCSDPRDIIYGILGMMSSKFVAAIHPQYSARVDDVFKDAVLKHIKHVQRLETIHFCDKARQRSDAPSWVPSFSGRGGSVIIRRFDQLSSGLSRAHFSYISPGTLRLYGLKIAEIQLVGDIGWHEQDGSVLIDLSKQPDDLFTAKYVSGESLLDAYLGALLMGQLRDRYPKIAEYPTMKEWAHTYTSAMPKMEKGFSNGADRIIYSKPTEDISLNKGPLMRLPHDHTLSFACISHRSRQLIQTCTGHIGLGPLSAQSGDLLCVLLGCDVPMLLRSRNDGAFEVIGACYTQGLSDSFALLGPLPEDWEMTIDYADYDIARYHFVNTVTSEETDRDPRLAPLPEEWEQYKRPWTQDDPEAFICFRNKVTGEEITYDPRMEPDALRARGVNIEQFDLV